MVGADESIQLWRHPFLLNLTHNVTLLLTDNKINCVIETNQVVSFQGSRLPVDGCGTRRDCEEELLVVSGCGKLQSTCCGN